MDTRQASNRKATVERVASLILDESIYPRSGIGEQRIGRLADALRAGVTLPALIVDTNGRRLIDGVHRSRAYLRVFGAEAETLVEWRTYPGDQKEADAAAFTEAANLNAGHGEPLSSYDLAHCLDVARRLSIPDDELPAVLSLTIAKVQQIRAERFATGPTGEQVLLKRSSRHLAGKGLTAKQVAGNTQSSGMEVVFHINQVINALESGLVDRSNPALAARLDRLGELIHAVP
jgi:hypothetical protein